ncbi:hypothetical protein [Bradyrhizobium sp. SZCCHNPS1003]|uniref:hypothetical protein n=1 Tax=Bradyrhizobium sp. SZCCHNPS1003 TaxID=3057330 RepID=UPI0028EE03F3|nr:hypothetical protein [Bradyrhizobium sp. SZCCHNPS1003]
MRNAMVADTKKHAEVMISWLQLDPKDWEPVTYGQKIAKLYSNSLLVYPARGVSDEHCDWVLEQLIPSTSMAIDALPQRWRLPQERIA